MAALCAADVTIYNRTVAKAQQLAHEFNCNFQPLTQLKTLDAKLVINCTSIGMHPAIDASPLPSELIKKDMTIFDTVYNPTLTKLLQNAQQAGATTINGQTMFINQAAEQFKLMKPTAAIVNTSRGPLIDEVALATALKNNEIACAGIDVFATEPLDPNSELRKIENITLSDHAAWYSEEGMIELKTRAAQNVAKTLTTGTPNYPVKL